MKISFIFNNCSWGSINQKVANICAFFSPSIKFKSSYFKTYFTNIPFEKVNTINGIDNTLGTAQTVSADWYNQNVVPLALDADIIVFYLDKSDITGQIVPAGICDQTDIVIFGQDENYRAYVEINGVETDIGNDFEIFCEHEISHALYYLNKKIDNTHKYFYSGNPKGVLPDMILSKTDYINMIIRKILQALGLMSNELTIMEQNTTANPVPNTPASSTAVTPPTEPLKFDNPTNSEHSVRVLCDECGLNWDQKNIIWACVKQESDFMNYKPDGTPTKHENIDPKTGVLDSTDWGIAQINDHYHIGTGKDFPSVDYVMLNPELMIRFMIQCYKNGNLGLWSSFKTGAYLKWLPYKK